MPKRYGVSSRHARPATCRTCGNPPPDGELISFRGYCSPCALAAITEAARQLQAQEGPHYDRWVLSMQAAVERVTSS